MAVIRPTPWPFGTLYLSSIRAVSGCQSRHRPDHEKLKSAEAFVALLRSRPAPKRRTRLRHMRIAMQIVLDALK